MNWYWVIVGILAYKFVDNLVKYLRCLNLRNRYVDYLMTDTGIEKLLQAKKDVQSLIFGANVENYSIPWTQPAGFGLVNTMKPSVLGQFPSRIDVFAQSTLRMFEEAIGVYKRRMFETFNPLYWVDAAIWLPKRFLSYLGINNTNFAAKALHCLFQGAYWLATAAFIAYNQEARALLAGILERMQAALLR